MNYSKEFARRLSIDGRHAVSEAIAMVGGLLAGMLRSTLQRPAFGHLGKGSVVWRTRLILNPRFIFIGSGVTVRAGARLEAIRHYKGRTFDPRLEIRDRTFVEFDCHIACAHSVVIEEDVLIAGSVFISDHNHTLPENGGHPLDGKLQPKSVRVGAGSWLGEGCAILPGVTLGKQCIVGAHAVVTRSFPDGSVVAGVPARLLRSNAVHSQPTA